MTTSLVLRFLHVLAAALWLGAVLSWPGALRRGLKGTASEAAPALAQARSGVTLDLGAGLATLVTGLLYASPLGGVPLRIGIVIGLALALARLALLFALARPTLHLVVEKLAGGDVAGARTASRRLSAYVGTAHLLWLLALVTMIFPI
jgi:hypothetical protein